MTRATFGLCVAWTILGIASSLPASAATRHVVVLYDERPDLPGLALIDASLSATLASHPGDSVQIFREAMDLSRVGSEDYLPQLRDHLRAKYARLTIDVVVAVLGPSLDFLLSEGSDVFPGTPIVFCGIDPQELGGRPLPSHVTGVLMKREFRSTLEIALKLHPDTRHVVHVAGTSEFDQRLLSQVRQEFAGYDGRLDLTFMTDLPFERLLQTLANLPPETIVLYSTLFQDGAGQAFVPHAAVERISEAANAPVYGFVDQYLGHGIVGGHLYTLRAHGEHAGNLALRILAGATPSSIAPVELPTLETRFDSRQLERWGISERSLPPGSIVDFREPSLWSQYKLYVLGAVAVVAVQALTIFGLLVQRARRRRAEIEMLKQRAELAHLNRIVTTGQLAASIAHQLSQPLMAIMTNAGALQKILDRREPIPDEAREIVADILKDDKRAAEIIRHMRRFLRKRELVNGAVEVNELVAETVHLVGVEAATRNVRVKFEPQSELPCVAGDRVLLQQVMMNLVLNALEAMTESPEDSRWLTIRTGNGDGAVTIDVRDSGTGIPREQLERLFEPFQSTKKDGLGIGLSITRAIVDAHGGRIWAENNADRGATFHVALRAAGPAQTFAVVPSSA